MSTTSKSNVTHRKRLARAFAERSGRPYAKALGIVTRAAEAGRLPEPLDDAGMVRAIEILMGAEPDTARQRLHAAAADWAVIAVDAGEPTIEARGPDPDALIDKVASWAQQEADKWPDLGLVYMLIDPDQVEALTRTAHDAEREGGRSLYLIRPALAALRLVWQGRVAKEPHRDASRFTIDDKPASADRDVVLFLLERDGYITAPLLAGEEWTIARTTDFGDQALAANHADVDKFRDGLPAGAGLDDVDTEPDREPYVGRGADGARRSAEIDRSEADGLDHNDPRHAERLASADRWERQAERLDQQRMIEHLIKDRDAAAFVDRVRGVETSTATTPVSAALAAVEKQPFSTDEGGRRQASSPADQRIWDLSWVYEHLTGSQGLVYISSPGQGADRYVFGGHHTALGRADALEHITGLVEALRLRDDLAWPPREEAAQDAPVPPAATSRWFVDIPREFAKKEHPYWARPVPEYAGQYVAVDTVGDQYVAQDVASLVLGIHGWGGIASTVEMGPDPDGVIGQIIGHRHRVVARGGNPDCLGCASPHLKTWGWQVGGGVVCKACAADVHAECAARRRGDWERGRDGSIERRCHCWCRDEAASASAPAAATESGDAQAADAEQTAAVRVSWRVAHEGNAVDRCTGSSWRDKASKKDPHGYGPGGYNRCVKAVGHDPVDGGNDPHHVDEWGHVFLLHPSFRVVRRVDNDEMAAIAREAGMHVSDGSDMQSVSTFPPRQNTLWVTGGKGSTVEIVKVSNFYEDEQRVTAQVVHPVPPRTTVRSFSVAEVRKWREPTDADVRRYERAWGLED